MITVLAADPAAAQGAGQGRGAQAPEAVEGRFLDVIVVLDPAFAPGGHAANRAEAARVARGLGVASPQFAYGTALFGFAARIPEGRLAALSNHPRVLFVDFDAPVSVPVPRTAAPPWCAPESTHPACQPDDGGGEELGPTVGQEVPWGVERIAADLNGNAGAGIHVYVIDTGVDADHPDLRANLGNGYAIERCRGGGCRYNWDDDNGHGTHVAGTIGAVDNAVGVVGVAPGVTLHAVKVLSRSGSGSRSGVIAGVDWVASEVRKRAKPAVANMSLGGSGSKSGTCSAAGFSGTDSYHRAICNAARAGVVFAVAAGNEGADAQNAVPAAYDDAVIAVSATMQGDDWPSWSNWGDNAAGWTPYSSAPVAIAAPGVGVQSTWNNGGTATKSGTSMAAPHVAGAAALYLASNAQSPDFTAFANTRTGLLDAAEGTDGFANGSGKPHAEDFLSADGL
ncbi:MAG TPA: S8 family serine peptidase [Geminicoccaceae bacterium]|nr:S8 family serine peptidase [Geminicoccaceae bacterium]